MKWKFIFQVFWLGICLFQKFSVFTSLAVPCKQPKFMNFWLSSFSFPSSGTSWTAHVLQGDLWCNRVNTLNFSCEIIAKKIRYNGTPAFWHNTYKRILFFRSKENKAYMIDLNGCRKLPVYCNMDDAGLGDCGGGGWTLVMKINGAKVSTKLILLIRLASRVVRLSSH